MGGYIALYTKKEGDEKAVSCFALETRTEKGRKPVGYLLVSLI